jgi:DNA-binding CsgD family transcriptional regulator
MERLTKKELRALLEFIKECYSICDIETFTRRVLSRLSKIFLREFTSSNGGNPPRRRNAYAAYPHDAYTPSKKKIFRQRVHEHPVFIQHAKARDTTRGQLHSPGVTQEVLSALRVKYQIAPQLIKQVTVNGRSKHLAERDQLLLKLLGPHLIQALSERCINLGLIVFTRDGKVRLATTCAVQQVRNYLGDRSLRGNRLPDVLWRWVKQQEVAPRIEGDVRLRRSPLVLEHQGKRLMIRLVPDSDQSSFLLDEHWAPMQPPSVLPRDLSPREGQVLGWLSQGKTNKDIGVILELSARTVQKHLEHIYRKLGVETRTGAVAKAYEIASTANKQMLLLAALSLLMQSYYSS